MDNNNKNFIITNFYNFIKTSLEYTDNTIEDLKLKNQIVKTQMTKKNNENYIICYNKNNDIVLEKKYQIIGLIDRKQLLFSWAWGVASLDDSLKFHSKEILNYGLKLSQENIIIKLLLTKSEIKCTSNLFEDVLIAIISYLLGGKKIWLMRLDDNSSILGKKLSLVYLE